MKKIILFLFFSLVFIFQTSIVSAAPEIITYKNILPNSLWLLAGSAPAEKNQANKCSDSEDFCLCNLQAYTSVRATNLSVYSGIFTDDGEELFSFENTPRPTESDRFPSAQSLTATLKMNQADRSCTVNYNLPAAYAHASDYIMWPTVNCTYVVSNKKGCCCLRQPDGSMNCEEKEKDDRCVLNCDENPAAIKYDDAQKGCSVYEVALTPKTTLNPGSIENLKLEAKKQLSFIPWALKGDGVSSVTTLIGGALNFLMGAIGSILLLFYVYAGILWMTAGGNDEKLKKSKTIIFWCTFSILVQFFAYILVLGVFKLLAS